MARSQSKPKAGWKAAEPIQTDKITEAVSASIAPQVEKPAEAFDSDSAKKDKHSRKMNALDPLTNSLGAQGYEMNRRWEWLFFMFGGARYNLSVDRFYREHSLAIDLRKPEKEEYLIDVKRELCVENGIKYYYCRNSEELELMVNEVLSSARGIQ
jgi:hypothetical protein